MSIKKGKGCSIKGIKGTRVIMERGSNLHYSITNCFVTIETRRYDPKISCCVNLRLSAFFRELSGHFLYYYFFISSWAWIGTHDEYDRIVKEMCLQVIPADD